MNKTDVVDSTNMALLAPTITIPVTFRTGKWPVIVESMAKGSWTATGSEKLVATTITTRCHADGRALVSHQSLENETYLSEAI